MINRSQYHIIAFFSLLALAASPFAFAEEEVAETTDALDGAMLVEDKASSASDKSWKQRKHRHILKEFDKDGDGKLSEEEHAAAKPVLEERRQAHRAKILEQFDANQDGKLNKAERFAFFNDRLEKRPKMKKRILTEFDKDGDGTLSEDERQKAFKKWQKMRKNRRASEDS